MPVQLYSKSERRFKAIANFTSSDPKKEDDTRTITIERPRGGLSMTDVIELQEAARGVLIGDRDGDPFYGFSSPEVIEVNTVWALYEKS